MTEIKVVRDEDGEVVGFTDELDEGIPEYAIVGTYACAIVTGMHDFPFDNPIWVHPDTAMELEEAGALNILPDNQVQALGVETIYLYELA